MSVIRKSMFAAALLVASLPGVAAAQGWGGGGYGQDNDGRAGAGYGGDRGDGYRRGGDYDRRGEYDRRGGDYDRRGGDYDRRGGDYDRRGWDGDRRRHGWGGGPQGGAGRWWNGRLWSYGAGPCWRWSQWRQNWKWVCD
jgi:hypothetical protein